MRNKYNNHFNNENVEINNNQEEINVSENLVSEIDDHVTEEEMTILESNDSIVEVQNEESIQNEKVTNTIQYVKVITKVLNIRNTPNKDGGIVTLVYENDQLTCLETNPVNGFYHIKTNTGIEGYCMEQYVELV